jgi:hypothetical protein
LRAGRGHRGGVHRKVENNRAGRRSGGRNIDRSGAQCLAIREGYGFHTRDVQRTGNVEACRVARITEGDGLSGIGSRVQDVNLSDARKARLRASGKRGALDFDPALGVTVADDRDRVVRGIELNGQCCSRQNGRHRHQRPILQGLESRESALEVLPQKAAPYARAAKPLQKLLTESSKRKLTEDFSQSHGY